MLSCLDLSADSDVVLVGDLLISEPHSDSDVEGIHKPDLSQIIDQELTSKLQDLIVVKHLDIVTHFRQNFETVCLRIALDQITIFTHGSIVIVQFTCRVVFINFRTEINDIMTAKALRRLEQRLDHLDGFPEVVTFPSIKHGQELILVQHLACVSNRSLSSFHLIVWDDEPDHS